MNGLRWLGRFGLFVGRVIYISFTNPFPFRKTLEEAYHIGVGSFLVLVVLSFFVGTNIALQGYSAFADLGGKQFVGMFVALAGVRELAPIMVASLIAAKSGTEMASQIAVMRIREQVDALEVMAINPIWYLVTPRLFGIVFMLPALTILSIFILIGSAWMVAVWQLHMSGNVFWSLLLENIRLIDFMYCMIKSFAFGAIICFLSCYFGYQARGGPLQVGRATYLAVVMSAVGCALVNYGISEVLYH